MRSPNDVVRLHVSVDDHGRLIYSVSSRGRTRLEAAPAGVLVDGADLGSDVSLGEPRTWRINETYPWRGNKSRATNDCLATEIRVHSQSANLDWVLEARVFDDGAGFRYRVPGDGTRRIDGEPTRWQLPAASVLWFQTNTVNYEGVYQSSRADRLFGGDTVEGGTPAPTLGPPVTVVYEDESFGLITEASLYKYSGMTLRPDGPARFQAVFEDDPDGWTHQGLIVSPWRVIVLSQDLNGLVNSDVIPSLCDPPDPELFPNGLHTEWIRPGKAPCTWMVFGNDGAEWHRQKWFVDVAAATGCEYLLVDAGWRSERWGWLKDGGDLWLRAAQLCRYAEERGVGIVLWHAFPEGRDDSPGLVSVEAREEFLRNCRQAGVKGVKIDFFDSESKAVVEACEDLLRRSAKHQLMINFHGANKPTGEPRTWPNEVTREGIREQEYVLWDSLPLSHYGALPFTRMAAGHADFLPGYVRPKFLKNTDIIFQMASVIIFSSPFLCWPDHPEAYLDSPLLQFVRSVPVDWDETRILPGSAIGETVLMARRKGADWYVAALNCQSGSGAREFEIDLSSLDLDGKQLTVYRDLHGTTSHSITSGHPAPLNGRLPVRLRPGQGRLFVFSRPTERPAWR